MKRSSSILQSAATADAKLKDEGHGEGGVDVKPIAPEVSSQG
jgi:hypothetical protein